MGERLGRKLGEMQDAELGAKGPKPCVEVDETAGFAVEFQPAPGAGLVLPYQHFSHVVWDGEHPTLVVVFATHEVCIEGERLESIKTAMARGRNVVIRAVASPRKGAEKSEPFVARITVTERKPDHAEPDERDGIPGESRP